MYRDLHQEIYNTETWNGEKEYVCSKESQRTNSLMQETSAVVEDFHRD